MSDMWEGAAWNENGELVIDVYANSPKIEAEITADEIDAETDTFDRGGFYVHGGWEPGSNGCIDLTSQMDDFTKWFENNGHDLIVNVKYE